MKFIFALLISSVLATKGFAEIPNFLTPKEGSYEIVFHNRPLVKVHGKTFSVMDVKKKMDLFLQENRPETFSSNLLRYQFYTGQWRSVLQEMINNELIQMEAEDLKISIPDGDIREEMEKRFGPNIIKKLDELLLSYDEAKEIVRDDIILRNLSWFRIWSKVLHNVTPERIKSEYVDYLAKLPLTDQWVYKMVSLRGDDDTGLIAKQAYNTLVQSQEIFLDQPHLVKINETLPPPTKLTVSEPITVASKDLAPEVLEVLQTLPLTTFSKPILQKSRTDGSSVHRMFYLIDHKKDSPPPFEELSSQVYDLLIQKYGEAQREEYFAKLRKRFLCEDLLVKNLFPSSYQPFSLCGS